MALTIDRLPLTAAVRTAPAPTGVPTRHLRSVRPGELVGAATAPVALPAPVRPLVVLPRPADGPPRRRATRSVRLAVGGVLSVVLLCAVLMGTTAPTGSPVVDGTDGTELHVVGPGDTLWSLAAEHLPEMPRAEAVEALVRLNGGTDAVRPGDVVAVPLDR